MTVNLYASSTRWLTNFYKDDSSIRRDRRYHLHSRVADGLHRASFFLLPGCPTSAEGKQIKLIADEIDELSRSIPRLNQVMRTSLTPSSVF